MASRTAEKAQTNGQAQTFTLTLQEQEVGLLNQVLRQGTFSDPGAKMLAASVQMKIEQIIQEVVGE